MKNFANLDKVDNLLSQTGKTVNKGKHLLSTSLLSHKEDGFEDSNDHDNLDNSNYGGIGVVNEYLQDSQNTMYKLLRNNLSDNFKQEIIEKKTELEESSKQAMMIFSQDVKSYIKHNVKDLLSNFSSNLGQALSESQESINNIEQNTSKSSNAIDVFSDTFKGFLNKVPEQFTKMSQKIAQKVSQSKDELRNEISQVISTKSDQIQNQSIEQAEFINRLIHTVDSKAITRKEEMVAELLHHIGETEGVLSQDLHYLKEHLKAQQNNYETKLDEYTKSLEENYAKLEDKSTCSINLLEANSNAISNQTEYFKNEFVNLADYLVKQTAQAETNYDQLQSIYEQINHTNNNIDNKFKSTNDVNKQLIQEVANQLLDNVTEQVTSHENELFTTMNNNMSKQFKQQGEHLSRNLLKAKKILQNNENNQLNALSTIKKKLEEGITRQSAVSQGFKQDIDKSIADLATHIDNAANKMQQQQKELQNTNNSHLDNVKEWLGTKISEQAYQQNMQALTYAEKQIEENYQIIKDQFSKTNNIAQQFQQKITMQQIEFQKQIADNFNTLQEKFESKLAMYSNSLAKKCEHTLSRIIELDNSIKEQQTQDIEEHKEEIENYLNINNEKIENHLNTHKEEIENYLNKNNGKIENYLNNYNKKILLAIENLNSSNNSDDTMSSTVDNSPKLQNNEQVEETQLNEVNTKPIQLQQQHDDQRLEFSKLLLEKEEKFSKTQQEIADLLIKNAKLEKKIDDFKKNKELVKNAKLEKKIDELKKNQELEIKDTMDKLVQDVYQDIDHEAVDEIDYQIKKKSPTLNDNFTKDKQYIKMEKYTPQMPVSKYTPQPKLEQTTTNTKSTDDSLDNQLEYKNDDFINDADQYKLQEARENQDRLKIILDNLYKS